MMYEAIKSILEQGLSGAASWDEVEEYLAEHLQDILDSGDQRAQVLADQLQVLFVKRSIGELTSDDVAREIYKTLDPSFSLLRLLNTDSSNATLEREFSPSSSSPSTINFEYQSA
ncbi:hypothetical protein [Candidatus Nitrospira bockiana]